MIKFTEKAAGVVSERNRLAQKPQTLQNLKQKLLPESDEDEEPVGSEEAVEEVAIEGEMMEPDSEPPLKFGQSSEGYTDDNQLYFSSEMISIDELESRKGTETNRLAQKFNSFKQYNPYKDYVKSDNVDILS